MRVLYIDCQMGVAGDMLVAALMELIADKEAFLKKINEIGLPGICVSHETVIRDGTFGNQIHVSMETEEDMIHCHRNLQDIKSLINALHVSDKVKTDAKAVYHIIASAESFVHGQRAEDVHFHEVGGIDAVADVVGACLLMEELGAELILASPIQVGSGSVRCAHGLLNVPTPATARILEGMSFYSGEIKGELCTPTGAALIKYFVQRFDSAPQMRVEKAGRGMGTKEFPGVINGIKVVLGETERE